MSCLKVSVQAVELNTVNIPLKKLNGRKTITKRTGRAMISAMISATGDTVNKDAIR